MKEVQKYEFAENVVDTGLFAWDELTFAVLKAIVNNKCTLVMTDHDRFVICYSSEPFPVWLWTAADITEAEKEEIWELCRREDILPGVSGKYNITCYNISYEMAEFFRKKAKEESIPMDITMNMLVYECFEPKKPLRQAGGNKVNMLEGDLDDVTQFIWQFKQDIGTDIEELPACREKAKDLIGKENFFLWKNGEGKNVAMCNYKVEGDLARVGLVFCKHDERRKGYAENLVYEVTKLVKDKGYRPILYTNADYAASNGCYMKVGYEKKGSLCSIGV